MACCAVPEQMWHGGYYLNLANLGGRRDFYGVSGDPVLFRYKVKDVGTAAPADVSVRGARLDTMRDGCCIHIRVPRACASGSQ